MPGCLSIKLARTFQFSGSSSDEDVKLSHSLTGQTLGLASRLTVPFCLYEYFALKNTVIAQNRNIKLHCHAYVKKNTETTSSIWSKTMLGCEDQHQDI